MIGLKNLVDNLEINLLNTERYTAGREWNYRNINNPYSRIYYAIDGSGQIEHHGQTYPICPGNLYLIPCFTTVHLSCGGHFAHYYVHFISRIQTGLDILSIFKSQHQISASEYGIDESLFRRLLELNPNRKLIEYDARKPIYREVLDRAKQFDQEKSISNILESNAILRILLAAFFRDYEQPKAIQTLHGLKRFANVLDFIRENLNAPITLEELAELANLNPTYFSNLFSKLMGIPPIQYINKRRIEKAQKLLLSNNETLYQIARQIGFADEYYFSRIFKKTVGISPDQYRKQEQILHQR